MKQNLDHENTEAYKQCLCGGVSGKPSSLWGNLTAIERFCIIFQRKPEESMKNAGEGTEP